MMDPADLHAQTLTLDTHIDIPWPNGPDPFENTKRRVDIGKMHRGGLRAGIFAAYIPQGPRTPEGHAAAKARALAMLDTINAMGRAANGLQARVASTVSAIEKAHADGAAVVIPAVENGYAVGDDLGALAEFRARGAVYMTMTHNGHNNLADSSNPRQDLGDAAHEHGGLSELGHAAVAEMNRLGMLVDISHTSLQAALQCAVHSRTPVVATHSCVRALCNVPRNVDDTMLDAVRDCGGVVHVTAVPSFLKPGGKADDVTVSDFADHVDYIVKRIGLAHCGISSDFDGGGGFSGWRDASESANITAELVRRGYGAHEIGQLWSGNFLRLMRAAETVAANA